MMLDCYSMVSMREVCQFRYRRKVTAIFEFTQAAAFYIPLILWYINLPQKLIQIILSSP